MDITTFTKSVWICYFCEELGSVGGYDKVYVFRHYVHAVAKAMELIQDYELVNEYDNEFERQLPFHSSSYGTFVRITHHCIDPNKPRDENDLANTLHVQWKYATRATAPTFTVWICWEDAIIDIYNQLLLLYHDTDETCDDIAERLNDGYLYSIDDVIHVYVSCEDVLTTPAD